MFHVSWSFSSWSDRKLFYTLQFSLILHKATNKKHEMKIELTKAVIVSIRYIANRCTLVKPHPLQSHKCFLQQI